MSAVGNNQMALAQFATDDKSEQVTCQCDDFVTIKLPGGMDAIMVSAHIFATKPGVREILKNYILYQSTGNTNIFIKANIPQYDLCIKSAKKSICSKFAFSKDNFLSAFFGLGAAFGVILFLIHVFNTIKNN